MSRVGRQLRDGWVWLRAPWWPRRMAARVAQKVWNSADAVLKDYARSVARWHEAERNREDAGGIFCGEYGIFGGSSTGVSRARGLWECGPIGVWRGGLFVPFDCHRCGKSLRLEVSWLEVSAIAADVDPGILPPQVRSAFSLEAPSSWIRYSTGGWAPAGRFPCNCGGGYDEEDLSDVEWVTYRSRRCSGPELYPAEVRVALFALHGQGDMPPWFFAAVVGFWALSKVTKSAPGKCCEDVDDSWEPEEETTSAPAPAYHGPKRGMRIVALAEDGRSHEEVLYTVDDIDELCDRRHAHHMRSALIGADGRNCRSVRPVIELALDRDRASKEYQEVRRRSWSRTESRLWFVSIKSLFDVCRDYPEAEFRVDQVAPAKEET